MSIKTFLSSLHCGRNWQTTFAATASLEPTSSQKTHAREIVNDRVRFGPGAENPFEDTILTGNAQSGRWLRKQRERDDAVRVNEGGPRSKSSFERGPRSFWRWFHCAKNHRRERRRNRNECGEIIFIGSGGGRKRRRTRAFKISENRGGRATLWDLIPRRTRGVVRRKMIFKKTLLKNLFLTF